MHHGNAAVAEVEPQEVHVIPWKLPEVVGRTSAHEAPRCCRRTVIHGTGVGGHTSGEPISDGREWEPDVASDPPGPQTRVAQRKHLCDDLGAVHFTALRCGREDSNLHARLGTAA